MVSLSFFVHFLFFLSLCYCFFSLSTSCSFSLVSDGTRSIPSEIPDITTGTIEITIRGPSAISSSLSEKHLGSHVFQLPNILDQSLNSLPFLGRYNPLLFPLFVFCLALHIFLCLFSFNCFDVSFVLFTSL